MSEVLSSLGSALIEHKELDLQQFTLLVIYIALSVQEILLGGSAHRGKHTARADESTFASRYRV